MWIKASELEPGDVIQREGAGNGIVLTGKLGKQHLVWDIQKGQTDTWTGASANIVRTPLTPAQQHADEMLEALKSVAGIYPPWHHSGYVALLNKIEPKPPTLDEAVELLKAVAVSGAHPDIAAFLERAKCN